MSESNPIAASSLPTLISSLWEDPASEFLKIKKYERIKKIRKWIKTEVKRLGPSLAPYLPKLGKDFEHQLYSKDMTVAKISFLVRCEPNCLAPVKRIWNVFWGSSDEEEDVEEAEYKSARQHFSEEEEEEEKEGEDEVRKKKGDILIRGVKELLKDIMELEGRELEDKEVKEIIRGLIDLPELVEDTLGDLPEGVEASIPEGGTFVIPADEDFSKGKELIENVARDREIVWPPVVIILNTALYKDYNGKWLGMGDAEVLEYFNSFKAMGSHQAYGPQGHRGMSVLIFEDSAVGFMEAERLSKHLEDKGTDREGWRRSDRVLILPTGHRQLYGYMAEKREMAVFNMHAQGESKLKFEMRSYREMVANPMKKMSEDYYLLNWYTNKVAKDEADNEKFLKTLPMRSRSSAKYQSREIVWPPMVTIYNTKLGEDKYGKMLGMGDAELLEYFSGYKAVRSQQSYGPKGHRGMSVLIFEASLVGFMEATRLGEYVEDIGPDLCGRIIPSGQRHLYGYMADKKQMDTFNKHAQGVYKLKYEMRSYQEKIVNPLKQMSEEFNLWKWYMNRVAKGKQHSKALEESFGTAAETKLHH